MRDDVPVRLEYAARGRQASARLAAAFTVVAVIVVLGSGSIAWALLAMRHR